MPYIKKEDRSKFQVAINHIPRLKTTGDLNYLITQVCVMYLDDVGEKYQTYNDIIGALECCKMELYRRKIAQYEDKKIKENGEVY
jgi:hypothetical protein